MKLNALDNYGGDILKELQKTVKELKLLKNDLKKDGDIVTGKPDRKSTRLNSSHRL